MSEATEARIDEVRLGFEEWAGNVHDHQAAAVVKAHWLNGPQDACLDRAGVPFEGWSGWEGAISGARLPAWYQALAVLPPVRYFSFEPQTNALAARLQPLLVVDPPEEYRATIGDCSVEGDVGGEDELATYTNPAVVQDLHEAWMAVVQEVAERTVTDSVVLGCFTSKHLPAPFDVPPGTGGEAWEDALDALRPPAWKAPLPGEPTSDRWEAYLAAEKEFLLATWQCHEDSFDEAMAQLAQAAEAFAEEHIDQIDAAQEAWARTRGRAEELGWTPDKPLAAFPLDDLPLPADVPGDLVIP